MWNTSTKSLIPDQTSPTADIHPSRRCKELLRAKMAAEQTLTSPASTQNSPNFSAYTQALAMHQAAQTVFNLSSVAAHHTSTDTGPKSNAIQATNGPIAPSFTYSYTYRDPAGDIAFAPRTIVGPAPSNNGTGGQVASDPNVRPPDDLRSVDLNITGYPVLQHAQNVEGAAETTPPAFEYWAPPPGTSTFEPTPYPPMDSTKLGYQKSAGASSPSFERDCSPFPPTYVWPQASQQSFNGQSANSLIPASRVSLDGAPPTSFDSFLNAYPYMWNERISRPTVDERIATPPQPPAELPKLSRKTTDSSVPLLPSHVNDTYQASPPAFASLVQRELRFAPHAGSRRQGQRESHEGLEPPIPSPTASTSSHASIHVAVSSPINQRMSLYATMDGVGPLSGQGNYISAMEGQANGGSASMYDNVGSSASGSGSNGGNDGANGHNSGYDLGGHRVGGSGDGDGDGDGEGEGEGDGGVDDEQRRQKKLSLACHFCRRRKLK